MSLRPTHPDSPLLARSDLCRWLLEEREEILRLKWLESEKRGRDIGMDAAVLQWTRHHRQPWWQARQTQRRLNKQR